MRPYLAIIVDSFREAMASRVLWVLIAFITLMLAALVPFHWKRELTTQLVAQDILHLDTVRDWVLADSQDSRDVGERLLWNSLPGQRQDELRRSAEAEQDASMARQRFLHEVTSSLNGWIQEGQLSSDTAWSGLDWTDEGRQLLEKGSAQLDDNRRQRLNRLALEAGLPKTIRSHQTRSIVFCYLVWDVFGPIPMSDEMLQTIIETGLSAFINLLVGFVGIFTGILVTASMIPRTFESGSVSLLLSKPITRPMLFLTKFFGGCSFVLLNAAYLVIGLWLITGWRWGMWNHRLLWTIPIFLLVFAIYYSVSALSGLIWRSTIISIAMTVLFWFLCFAVGLTRDVTQKLVISPERLISIQLAGDTWIGTSENQRSQAWNPRDQRWQEIFGSEKRTGPPAFVPMQPLVGPVYDSQHDRLVAIQSKWPAAKLLLGSRDEAWKRQEVASIPPGISHLFRQSDGTIIAVDTEGVLRLVDEPKPVQTPKILGFSLPIPAGEHESFQRIGPEPTLTLGNRAAIAQDASADRIYIAQGGTITRLGRADDRHYRVQHRRELADPGQSVLIAAAGPYLLLAHADGLIQVRDTEKFDLVADFTPFGKEPPRCVSASPTGRSLAVLFHTDQLWLYDTKNQTVRRRIPGQGDISAITWLSDDQLVLVDRINRLRQLTLLDGTLETPCRPRLRAVEWAYLYVVEPVYRIFPKPGKLEETINFALRGTATVAPDLSLDNLETPKFKTDPWGPVWSGLAFMTVVLGIGCLYVRRQDF